MACVVASPAHYNQQDRKPPKQKSEHRKTLSDARPADAHIDIHINLYTAIHERTDVSNRGTQPHLPKAARAWRHPLRGSAGAVCPPCHERGWRGASVPGQGSAAQRLSIATCSFALFLCCGAGWVGLTSLLGVTPIREHQSTTSVSA